jgi:DNA-binding NtrC family response regulator
MAKSTEETKQTAITIMEAVKSIYPQLAEVSKKTDFEITITGDKKGVYLEFSVEWDPTEDEAKPKGVTEAKPNREDEVRVEEVPEGVRMEDEERKRIINALQTTNGDKRKAAELAGLSERTFFRKCKEYGLKK